MTNEKAQKTVWDELKEEADSGVFWKPEEGKQNIVTFISDPFVGKTNFKKGGDEKKQFTFIISLADKPSEMVTWGVSSKPALRAIRKTMEANKLTSLVGATLQVVITGAGTKEVKYSMIPVVLPTPATISQIQASFPRAAQEKAFPALFAPTIPPAPQ